MSNNTAQVSYTIKVEGTPIPDEINVLSMRIEKNSKNQANAQIVMLDGDVSSSNFPVSSSAIFDGSKNITIEAGYDSVNQLIFSGQIKKQSIQINDKTGATFSVDCKYLPVENETAEKTETDYTPVLTISYGQDLLSMKADFENQDSTIGGQVKTLGTNLAESGKYFMLKDVGNKFSGSHFINKVVHQFQEGNWFTEIFFGTLQDDVNGIEINEDGITIKSAKGITIESSRTINLNGTLGIKQTSSGDIDISGLNINETAQAAYSASGNALTKISAGAELSLKAAMIMIN